MNRIILALAALVAMFALPGTSNATVCGKAHGCARAHHQHHHVRVAPAPRVVHVAPAPRVVHHARPRIDFSAMRAERAAKWAKFRADRAASGAAFRASLAAMFTRVPRPVVAAAPRVACALPARAARVVAAPVRVVAAPVRVAGCHHAGCGHRRHHHH